MKRIGSMFLVLCLLLTACGSGNTAPVETSEGSGGSGWQEQYDLGIRYLSEGKYAEAIIAFTAAIEIDPKLAPAYVGRGDAYVGSGETEENLTLALTDYKQAIELDESLPAAYLGVADIYIRRGEYDAALEFLKAALEKTGNDPGIADKIAEMEAGTMADAQGRVRRSNIYGPDGTLELYMDTTFDEHGNLLRSDQYDPDGALICYSLFESSEDGLRQYETQYAVDGYVNLRNVMVSDEDGKWLYTAELDENGNELDRTVAVYDENGEQIGSDSYDASGQLIQYERHEGDRWVYYDADGNMMGYEE